MTTEIFLAGVNFAMRAFLIEAAVVEERETRALLRRQRTNESFCQTITDEIYWFAKATMTRSAPEEGP